MQRGELFIISAPSGTGKTTLIRRLLQQVADVGNLVFSVSHTTRCPRKSEVNGRDYHFVSRQQFQQMIAADQFLEWAEVHNQLYGTSSAEVLPRLGQGIDVLLDIDVQGAEIVLERYPEAESIFLIPPSFSALEQRLRQRGLDDPQEIARRLSVSLSELQRYEKYRYVIINDDVDRAAENLTAIIVARRHLLDRMQNRVARVVADFQRRQTG